MKVSKEFKQFLKEPRLRRKYMGLVGAKPACVSISEGFVEDLWLDLELDSNIKRYSTWRMDTFPCGITVTYSDDFFRD